MSRDHTIKGERYWECDICGVVFRWSDTALNTAGMRVCKEHCLDEGEYRHPEYPTIKVIPHPSIFDLGDTLVTYGFWNTSGMTDLGIITEGMDDE